MGDAHQEQDVQGRAFDAAEAARAGSGGGGVVGTAGPGRILALQRTIGNAAVGRLVAGRGPEMRQLARSASPAVPRLRAPAVTLARFVDPDSPEYVRGYNDGRGNHDAAPGPLLDDALESYTEGYRRGKSEAEGSKTSSPPVAAPAPETPAPPETFTNPDLQQIYDANKPGKPNQLVAMKLLDTTVTGVWSKLTWGPLAKSAAARIYSPNLMAQGSLGTCGPATVLNFLGTSDPPAYAALVIEVYRDGTGKGSGVNKKLRDATPQPGMDALDWMMMSAVQDITNDWYDFHGTKEGEEAKREGTTSGDQRWAYKKFAGVVDATTIDLCLSVFPWAPFRSTKAAIKVHTLLDLRGNIPSFLHVTPGNVHEVNVLDLVIPEEEALPDRDRVDTHPKGAGGLEQLRQQWFQGAPVRARLEALVRLAG